MIGRRGGFRPFLVGKRDRSDAPTGDARRFRELILPHSDSG